MGEGLRGHEKAYGVEGKIIQSTKCFSGAFSSFGFSSLFLWASFSSPFPLLWGLLFGEKAHIPSPWRHTSLPHSVGTVEPREQCRGPHPPDMQHQWWDFKRCGRTQREDSGMSEALNLTPACRVGSPG